VEPPPAAASRLRPFLAGTLQEGDVLLLLNDAEVGWRGAAALARLVGAHQLLLCTASTAELARPTPSLAPLLMGGARLLNDVHPLRLEGDERLPWGQIGVVHWHVGRSAWAGGGEAAAEEAGEAEGARLRAHLRAGLAALAAPMLLDGPDDGHIRLLVTLPEAEAGTVGLFSIARNAFLHVVGLWPTEREEGEARMVTVALAAAMPSEVMLDELWEARQQRIAR